MKTLLFAFVITFTGAVTTPAVADPGSACHFHGSKQASETTVVQCANSRKDRLIKSGKLDKSWGTIKYDSVALTEGKKGKEWKIVYRNVSEADTDKSTLYMFFTAPGNFIAANFTGQ
jgi:hypothetical protein